MDFNSWNIFWKASFGLLATLISVGNVLTIWIFFQQKRRKRAYCPLISLAVADLLVGILAIPLYLKVMTSGGWAWFFVSIGADVFTGITSIYTLAVISVERMFAVGWPLRHRTLNCRVYICAIGIPWIIAAMFTTVVVFRSLYFKECRNYLYVFGLISGIPLITISVANFVVWKKQKSPFRNQNYVKREVKLAKTLALITATSLLTWLPFQIINILFELKVMENFHYFGLTIFIIKLLQFSNSLVNPILYSIRIPDFKRKLFQIFNCRGILFTISSPDLSPPAGTESVLSFIRFSNSIFPLSNVRPESSH